MQPKNAKKCQQFPTSLKSTKKVREKSAKKCKNMQKYYSLSGLLFKPVERFSVSGMPDVLCMAY